jgi:hypothetical protein
VAKGLNVERLHIVSVNVFGFESGTAMSLSATRVNASQIHRSCLGSLTLWRKKLLLPNTSLDLSRNSELSWFVIICWSHARILAMILKT